MIEEGSSRSNCQGNSCGHRGSSEVAANYVVTFRQIQCNFMG